MHDHIISPSALPASSARAPARLAALLALNYAGAVLSGAGTPRKGWRRRARSDFGQQRPVLLLDKSCARLASVRSIADAPPPAPA